MTATATIALARYTLEDVPRPRHLAVDACYVYWHDGGGLSRRAKSAL